MSPTAPRAAAISIILFRVGNDSRGYDDHVPLFVQLPETFDDWIEEGGEIQGLFTDRVFKTAEDVWADVKKVHNFDYLVVKEKHSTLSISLINVNAVRFVNV